MKSPSSSGSSPGQGSGVHSMGSRRAPSFASSTAWGATETVAMHRAFQRIDKDLLAVLRSSGDTSGTRVCVCQGITPVRVCVCVNTNACFLSFYEAKS